MLIVFPLLFIETGEGKEGRREEYEAVPPPTQIFFPFPSFKVKPRLCFVCEKMNFTHIYHIYLPMSKIVLTCKLRRMDNGNLKWAIHFFVTFLIFIEKVPYRDLKKTEFHLFLRIMFY